MMPHARSAVPWLLVVTVVVLNAILLRIVEWLPYAMWPLQGIAVGLLAAAAGWCFDEPAAALVDTLPRSLAWRTAARSAGVVVLVGAWLLAVGFTRDAYFGHAPAVAWQGVSAALASIGFATWRRSRGSATPARVSCAVTVCITMYLALARPVDGAFPIYPYASDGNWRSSTLMWTGLALAAVSSLIWVLAEISRDTTHATTHRRKVQAAHLNR